MIKKRESILHPIISTTSARDHMAGYLDPVARFQETKRVDWIPEKHLPSARMFCLIGTDRTDYEIALGLSRMFVGHRLRG